MKKLSVLITGGMGDIGQAIAHKFAEEGCIVYLLHHNSPEDNVISFCNSLSGSGMHGAFKCDITNLSEVESVINKIEQESPAGIDVCVHAAVSPIIRRRISLIDIDDFRQQFDVTAFGGLNIIQTVVGHMKKRGDGSIVGITTAALSPDSKPTSMAGYMCAKHALNGILREFYNDVSTNGIRVNAVAPGFVETQLHKDLPEAALALLRGKGSDAITKPEDVANVVLRLFSKELKNVSGKTFLVGSNKTFQL